MVKDRNITGDIYEFKGSPIKVRKTTIDEVISVKKVPTPDFIKIDVDGGELLVLKGADNTLNKYKPTIFVETHTENYYKIVLNI